MVTVPDVAAAGKPLSALLASAQIAFACFANAFWLIDPPELFVGVETIELVSVLLPQPATAAATAATPETPARTRIFAVRRTRGKVTERSVVHSQSRLARQP